MSEGFMIVVVFYALFSILFALIWTNSILDEYRFVDWYKDRLKNKNAFGKTYVTIFALLVLPSYLFAVLALYIYLVLQEIYMLGIKKPDFTEHTGEPEWN